MTNAPTAADINMTTPQQLERVERERKAQAAAKWSGPEYDALWRDYYRKKGGARWDD